MGFSGPIQAILFEPVGCLAEFPPEPFLEIAVHLFGSRRKMAKSGSRAYWHLLNLIESGEKQLDASVEALECQAVAAATLYEDVLPALAQLSAMGIRLLLASSLSSVAIARFLEQHSLSGFFAGVSTRDSAAGIKVAPLRSAVQSASIPPDHAIFLTDTAEGLRVAKNAGVIAILMMNDPDEARRLVMHEVVGQASATVQTHGPSGGIVSLHEVPDLIRFVDEKSRNPRGSFQT